MELHLRHQPSFTIARALMAPGEAVRAEAGAMLAMAADTQLGAKAEGGVLKSLKRGVLGGESFFITTATAGPQGGWIDVAPNLPGDVAALTVSADQPMNIQRGSFLLSEAGVNIETKWGGFKNLIGGEGGFLVRAEGQGQVLVSAYGAIDALELGAGESMIVDTGHMVAFSDSVQMRLERAASGWIQTAKTGEGFVFVFTGPGRVLLQSRNPSALVDWLTVQLPFSRN